MKSRMFFIGLVAGVLLAAATAALLGLWSDNSMHPAQGAVSPSLPDEREPKILYWVAPMDANYRRDGPGKSPMGMDLVPVYESAFQEGEVAVSPVMEGNLGVRIATAQRTLLKPDVEAFGVVGHNEDSRVQMTVRADGWIENLTVFDEGEMVARGQVLFDFYSPELQHAQDNYLSALAARDQRLIRGALGRMRSLAIPESRITALDALPLGAVLPEKFRTLPFSAPRDGHVAMLGVRDGGYITPSQIALEIVSIESVWVVAEVLERHAARVKVGQLASMRLDHQSNQRWMGEVEYLYPMLDVATRSQRVRLRFDNPGRLLKPNMFARVRIQVAEFEALSIPSEALIRTGSRSRVVKALGGGRFRSVEVSSGWQVKDQVVIRSGLEVGDRVVVSGQFLLDSESSLGAEFSRMEALPANSIHADSSASDSHTQMQTGDQP